MTDAETFAAAALVVLVWAILYAFVDALINLSETDEELK